MFKVAALVLFGAICLAKAGDYEYGRNDYDNEYLSAYDNDENDDIIGGRNLIKGFYPSMVQIKYNNRHWCGGTILSNNWVLTAAHCVNGKNLRAMRIVAGEHDLSRNERTEQIRVPQYYRLYNYNKGGIHANDIAIVYVSQGFNFNRYVQPVKLYAKIANFYQSWLYAIGWGQTGVGRGGATILQTLGVRQHSDSSCRRDFAANRRFGASIKYFNNNQQLCVEGTSHGTNACHGDSGGPLFYIRNGHKMQVGLTSYGNAGCSGDAPSIYVRPAAYRRFIDYYLSRSKQKARWYV